VKYHVPDNFFSTIKYLYKGCIELALDRYVFILNYRCDEELFGDLTQDAKDPETLANLVVCCLHVGKSSSRFLRYTIISCPHLFLFALLFFFF
jgi:hypothetical protein